MHVTIQEAAADLDQLVEVALAGEEVIISKGGHPVVRLAPIRRLKFQFGILSGQLDGPLPDFLEPMSEDELKLWEGGD